MFSVKKTDAEIASVLKQAMKYRHASFNRMISSYDQLYRFKDKLKNIEKLTSESSKTRLKHAKDYGIEIYIKDKKDKSKITLYSEEGTECLGEDFKEKRIK